LKWSDGNALTAADFKAGMVHDMSPTLCQDDGPYVNPNKSLRGAGCNQSQVFFLSYIVGAQDYLTGSNGAKDISGITAVDPQTLSFQLTQPIGFFLGEMATMASMPIESSALKTYPGNTYPLHYTENVSQSGPFRISAWQDPKNPGVKDPQHATEIVFVPNPHWWGKPVQLQKVIMPLISDLQAQYDLYTSQQGDRADYVTVPPHTYPFVQNLSDFHEVRSLSINFYGLNFADPPFDNLEVRQAFALGINKQSLIDTFFQGSTSPTNHIIPDGILGFNPSLVTPPDASTGSASLTGNQLKAQQLITHVAKGCEQNSSPDWCAYVIGVPGNGATLAPLSTSSLAANRACPKYNVLAAPGKDGALATTQQQVVAWAPSDRQERDLFNQAAVQQWSNILCLNIVSNEAIHQPILAKALINTVYSNPGTGATSPQALYTFGGYIADYPDPQDFTSNLFAPNNGTNGNNAANFGVKAVASNTGLGAELDITTQMNTADAELDPAKRIQMYQQIEQQLVFQVAVIPTDQPKLIYRLQPYVTNFTLPATGYVSDQSWSDVFIVAHN
ncbi:MAG: hypothetical protein H0X24_22020, partial [Ktedonobacterales bacterium]|nr:hypothetical protein [Ktedonobacterales bacterium]